MPANEDNVGGSTSQTSSNEEECGSHPIPPPFNPMGAPNESVAPNSVVGSLMEVYESLTNSQTPHEQQHQYYHQQHAQQHQQQYHYDHPAQSGYQQEYHPMPMQYTQYNMAPNAPPGPIGYRYTGPQEMYHYPPSVDQHPSQFSIPIPPQPEYYGDMPPPLAQPDPEAPSRRSKSDESVSSATSSVKSNRKRQASSGSDPQDERETRRTKRRGSSSSNSKDAKTRKKSKESDGRWSKRFTWPEALHRDFVSAIFDVGLKHSSPATILEHMPKHEQINSERVKSHLQKYRMHRGKSKKEFMTSYDSSYTKFKAPGGMDNVKTLTEGEPAAHLTLVAVTGESSNGAAPTKTKDSSAAAAGSSGAAPGQQGRPAPPVASPSQHEALMLPRLTEAEKSSPIGASMGYLLGLFFSLKRQLIQQRAASAAAVTHVPAATKNFAQSPDATDGPVTAVYNSFVGVSQSGSDPAFMVPPPRTGGGDVEWAGPVPAVATSGESLASPIVVAANGTAVPVPTAGVPNPVVPPQCTGSTRTNLEASSMMKREMKNQMAFQNKMRALKQQELFKFKNASGSPPSNDPGNNGGGGSEFGQAVEQHSFEAKSDGKASPSHGLTGYLPHEQQSQTDAMDSQNQEHQQDEQTDEEKAGGAGGHTVTFLDDSQGAGETAIPGGRARAPSMSFGAQDDFWNTDVVDEQLFEFLMNS